MINFLKSIWEGFLSLLGIKSEPKVIQTPEPAPDKQPDVPPVELEPLPPVKEEPVIIPTEPPIVVEPVPVPEPIEQPKPEPVAEVKPEPINVPEPVKPPVIVPLPKPEPDKPVEAIPEPVKPPVIIPLPKPEPKPPVAPPAAKTLRYSPVTWGLAWKDADTDKASVIKEAKKHFKRYTPENAAKPWHLHKKGKFDFTNLKDLVKIAKESGSSVHGHACFVWPELDSKMPDLLKDEKNYKQNITAFITAVLTEFKDDIHHWDLVNEAFEDNGTLKDCIAKRVWGDGYIKEIFKIAYKVAPHMKFFISDYNLQTNAKQAIQEIKYVEQMLKEGIAIHGFSSQMHITTDTFVVKNFESTLKLMVKTGLLIHFSELDIKVGMKQKDKNVVDPNSKKILKLFPFTPELQGKQAATYKQVTHSFRTLVPVKQQYGISLWSFTHGRNYMNIRYGWRTDYPAMFGDDFDGGLALAAVLEVK